MTCSEKAIPDFSCPWSRLVRSVAAPLTLSRLVALLAALVVAVADVAAAAAAASSAAAATAAASGPL